MRKWIVILLFLPLLGFSQVPDTETFKLDTVVDIVNPTTDDLQDCFNDAIPQWFNPTYYSNYWVDEKHSLLQFRDYKERTMTFYGAEINEANADDSYVDFSGSLSTAQQECYDYHNAINGLTNTMGGGAYSTENLSYIYVGQVIYLFSSPNFIFYPTGYYIDVKDGRYELYIVHIKDGIIQSITSCP